MPSLNPIEVENLKKYYGSVKAVDGISFHVNQGEVFGLLGPNGAGKTTTIEILEGLRKKDGGTIRVLGEDPWTQGYALHRKVGVIPQEFTFFEKITPREAIIYYGDLFGTTPDPDEILRMVLLEDSAGIMFDHLSGGQKQKTGLALALVNSPDLLFLDEPTTGLDPSARRAIWKVINGLKAQGKTIVLTTHYLEEAQRLSDRVAIVDHGKIVAMGTSDEIISEHGSGERLEIQGGEDLANYIGKNTQLEVRFENGMVKIPIRSRRDVVTALDAAVKSGFEWTQIRTQMDSLDDVFIKLVSGEIGEGGEVKTGDNQTSAQLG